MAQQKEKSYDSSDLKELMDNAGGWAENWGDILWYVENVAGYDADFAKSEIPPLKRDIQKVKQEGKPYTTDYRKLYEYINGKKCEGCPPPEGVISHGINPRKMADHWLKGLHFPAEKNRALQVAKDNQAPEKVINTLNKIDDKEYSTMGSLLENVGDVTWDHDR